jgi:chromatin segregation and condensation protein Rec8/ScpA/Scc1 (kleisin family)
MASLDMIARLADLREFDELCQHFAALKEEEVQRLARKTFALPEQHETVEWERLKARWSGIDEVLALPVKERKNRKEAV